MSDDTHQKLSASIDQLGVSALEWKARAETAERERDWAIAELAAHTTHPGQTGKTFQIVCDQAAKNLARAEHAEARVAKVQALINGYDNIVTLDDLRKALD